MARMWSTLAILAAALAIASGTRQPLQAATTPSADVVFIMEAAQATFTNATSLSLYGVTSTAQSYGAGAKTGIYPIQNFTDGSTNGQYVDSNGQWLSNPQAVMYGVTQTGNVTTVLLALSSPSTPQQPAGTVTNNNNNNNGGNTVTNNNGPPNLVFTVALVAADASKLKLQNGVVAQKIAEAASGAGNLAQSITPGASFGPVVFYIDQSQQGLPKKATTKWGWGGWNNGGWGNNGYYNNGWNGYNTGYGGSNNNNNNNNGGYGGANNNNNNNNNGYGGVNNNNNNNNNGGGYGASNNNNNNNNNGGYGANNNNNNNNNNNGK